MKNLMTKLVIGLKCLLREKMNFIILLFIINICISMHNYYNLNSKIDNTTLLLKKRIDFRYFNTTRTIESVFNVRVDTYNGEIRK